ncbi:carboxylesterase family protein [Hymenobacter wooponensis]|uniref:Carboxylesterase/lipase family protein n=1 Tax=Hymenobacter wooponensis TaxID=1525360 RepID=A0A4Z0MNE2_9BACT|nr:carboxylesterase family protein [Hymenobacter wooponensis]TGD80856.1 carboxylesterase/lipase family protein [Hymenobacter wooponensis]
MPSRTPALFNAPAGPIVGWREGDLLHASGIRYARAKRFHPPVPEPAAKSPIQATKPAPACPQVADPLLDQVLGDLFTELTFSEDCLRLSLTLPADCGPDERLPVIVWVHGGSYVSGAGDLPMYSPAALVQEQRVVFVAVTYRLGLLGFLGGEGAAPPNLGLLDLREALRWVQRNITAFKGDPALVTLLGHSSGADAIAHLLVAEGARGLFRRVIMHSAPLGLSHNRLAMNQAMLRATGALPAHAPVEEVLAYQERAQRVARRFGLKGGMPFGTQYGAYPLPTEASVERAWEAAAPEVDVLIGGTAHETRFFAVISPTLRLLPQVPLLGPRVTNLLTALSSRYIYLGPAHAFAHRHARAGGRAYLFLVTFAPAGSDFGGAHTIDLPLLLGLPEQWAATPLLGQATWSQVNALGRQVRQHWADFARTGTLPASLDIPGVLRVDQVTSSA